MKAVNGKRADTAVVLIIFCMFAMSVFTVLMLGVSAYRNIAETSTQGHEERVCLSFIWTRAKIEDEAGKMYVGDFHGLPALFIDEEYSGTAYQTAIYHYDGWIRELFFEARFDFLPRDGTRVVRSESLMLEQYENGLIKVTAGPESVYIFPRGREGAR